VSKSEDLPDQFYFPKLSGKRLVGYDHFDYDIFLMVLRANECLTLKLFL